MITLSRNQVIDLTDALEDAYANLQTEFGPDHEQERVRTQTMVQINFLRSLLGISTYYVKGSFGDPLPEYDP